MPGRPDPTSPVLPPDLEPKPALERIRAAAEAIEPHVLDTPTLRNFGLSKLTGQEVHLKLEVLQRTGAFKVRGALNKILHLSPEDRARGVIAASAGNHAQGVGMAAELVGVPATIVMPSSTPIIKVERTKSYGAHVELEGAHYEEAYQHARKLAEQTGATMVHPFDDPEVLLGQGTIALVLDRDLPEVDAVVVPVGGGGLIAGIALGLAALRPGVAVIGVQAENAAPMAASFRAGKSVQVERPNTIADGIQVGRVGDLTFPLVQRHVKDVLTVSEEQIAQAIVSGVEQAKVVLEGAGAAGLAALLSGQLKAYPRVALVLCGGNIDLNRLARVIESGLATAGRYHVLRAALPDRPGALADVTAKLAEQRINILEITHYRQGWKVPLGQVHVEILVETRGKRDASELEKLLTSI